MPASILPTAKADPTVSDDQLQARAAEVLRIEAQAVLDLVDTVDASFARACRLTFVRAS